MDIVITTEYITLDSFLKFAGACATGGAAKVAILGGEVKVNGEVCKKKGKKLIPGDKVHYNNTELNVVKNR